MSLETKVRIACLYAIDIDTITEQRLEVYDDFDFAFAENGLVAYKMGKQLESQSFIKWIGEDKYKKLVSFILHYIADMDIPIKRQVYHLYALWFLF